MALTWWLWILCGLVLLLVELITPGGFYFLFFGIGAILIGFLAAAGLAGPPAVQWLLFGIISVLALLLFRKPLQQRLAKVPNKRIDSMIGETAIATTEMARLGNGKAELRGTAWTARNVGDEPLTAGSRCRVERVDGLTLCVRGLQPGEEG